MTARVLCLREVAWSAHQLVMQFGLAGLRFSTVQWTPDVDLLDLERRFGRAHVERLAVHIALFELNKIASLRPDAIDLGPYAHHHTEALEHLWRHIFHKVWAQWRFENGLPHAPPPRFCSQPVAAHAPPPPRRDRDEARPLIFCGGGKDSLVTLHLFARAQIPFATLAYSSSAYGAAQHQHALIDGLLDRARLPDHPRHRQIVLDDFFDAPVLDLYGPAWGVKSLTAAETPSAIFSALPLLLSRGYPFAVLGHEASANRGNFTWAATGEEVNHQWGKSAEAEALLDDYIRRELVADIGVFSALMPIHDAVIFELLRQDQHALPATHSCNIRKPWCFRCPKCAYVWLSCRAHLDEDIVQRVFPEELLEVPENTPHFLGMLGLTAHTPFECIGQIEECRLALALLRAQGRLGPLGQDIAARLPPLPSQDILRHFAQVHPQNARIPAAFAQPILQQMDAAAQRLQHRVLTDLRGCEAPEGAGAGSAPPPDA